MTYWSKQPARWGLVVAAVIWLLVILPLSALAAPYAAMVVDARTGEVLHSRNADARLHPASLTKMMTLYIVFEAVENGEISLDTMVTITKRAAGEPPSKLGLKTGQKIRLRYLIRAAAVKSANDAATALGIAIEGSEARFARRMNRTAKALGMTRTTFRNAHGLTEDGHLSTARDMTILGRHLFYDYPEYYHLFSRVTVNAGGRTLYHTNRKLLRSYKGADGIKTGYTRAAGFNLTASAERNGERVIATVFGGRSVDTRNARVAELLDMGFERAPRRVAVQKPSRPPYLGKMSSGQQVVSAGLTRSPSAAAVRKSLRPQMRPTAEPAQPVAVAEATTTPSDIERALLEAQETAQPMAKPIKKPLPQIKPEQRPEDLVLASAPTPDPVQEVVMRVAANGNGRWGINVGRYPDEFSARKTLLQTALSEMGSLDGSRRQVVRKSGGFDANFTGMTREKADLACRRLQAKQLTCFMISPG